MFDATPARAKGALADHSPERILDLVAEWDGDATSLREGIDALSNWGPFELAECKPMSPLARGCRLFLCRFIYHGPAAGSASAQTRGQFESCLRDSLAGLATFRDAPQAGLAETSAS
ncbi:MAG: hypothetical protein AAFW81_01045 [Pseudomonadota bacterium]